MRARIWAPGAGAIVLASALVASIPAAASAAPVTGPEDFTIVVTGNRPQLFTAEGTLNATGTAVPVIMNGVNGGVDNPAARRYLHTHPAKHRQLHRRRRPPRHRDLRLHLRRDRDIHDLGRDGQVRRDHRHRHVHLPRDLHRHRHPAELLAADDHQHRP